MTVIEYKPERITSRKAAEMLRRNIADGLWRQGQRVPTIRSLADKVGTSTQTIQSALRIIEGEGLLQRKEGGVAVVANNLQESQKTTKPTVSLKQIGVLDPWLSDKSSVGQESWTSHIFSALKTKLFAEGYELVVMPYPDKDEVCGELVRRGLDGYVFFGLSRFANLHELLLKAGIVWVCLGGVGKNDEKNVVVADNFAGSVTLGQVFIRLGFKRILVLANNFELAVSDVQKATGLFSAYLRSGKRTEDLKMVATGSLSEQAGYENTKKYIEEFGKPDAIFATGDWLAKGACLACADIGLKVGDDVGVVGATGLDAASHYNPSLSVLRQPMEELGDAAAQMLLDMIANKAVVVPSRSFPTKLIIRDSLKVPDEAKEDIEKILQM